ncbi:unnamed protein product, partial [Mesorhabditis belari]|uniref:Uncharacterized protein n=1 Tax=Mesorhabditis belari TaxID=2138241 RepID=A0AAF3ETH2_9BILA
MIPGAETLLKNEGVVTALRIGVDGIDVIIPFRVTKPIKREDIKLFVDDEEWIEFCWNEHSVLGFNLSPLADRLVWSQFNNRRFRCQYKNETTDLFIQAAQIINIYNGIRFTANCTMESHPPLFFEAKKYEFKLKCPECDPSKDGPAIDHLIGRLEDFKVMENVEEFWKSAKRDHSQFCNWIEQLINGDDFRLRTPSLFEIPPGKTSTQEIRNSWFTGPRIVIIVILLLLLFSIFVFVVFRLKKKRAPVRQESIELLPNPNSFEQILIAGGAYGNVLELVGHTP